MPTDVVAGGEVPGRAPRPRPARTARRPAAWPAPARRPSRTTGRCPPRPPSCTIRAHRPGSRRHRRYDTTTGGGGLNPRRPPRSEPREGLAVIDEAVISRVLGAALRTGGDFAEVFAEDKRSVVGRARRRPGRGARPPGRDRGAGIRVVVGDTTGFAHTADLSEAGLRAAAEAAAAAAEGGGGGTRTVALTRQPDAPTRTVVELQPGDVAKAPRSSCCAGPTRPAAGRHGSITQVTARYGDSRRRILVANSDGLLAERRPGPHALLRRRASPPATPACRPAASSIGHTDRLRAVRPLRRRGARPTRPPTGPSPSSTPARRPAARCRS